jgi:hypothetical protein
VVSAGWWVAAVTLWPASSRPYIGGSRTNSILELTLGYNGLGRLTGDEVGSVGGAVGQAGRWGATGITRLFQADWGGQIAWLIPAAIVLGGACLVIAWRAPRTDRLRASVLLWGGWFAVTAAVLSYGAGIIHQYYAVALAPAIGALVGTGAVALWSRREGLWSRLLLAATLAGSAAWAFVLLDRSADWLPPLRYAVLAGGVTAALLIAFAPLGRRPLRVAVVTAGLAVVLAGPAAYAVDTALTPHTGSIPLAGPTATGASGMGGPGGGQGGMRGGQLGAFAAQQDGQGGAPPAMPAAFAGTAPGAAPGAQGDGQGGQGAPGGGLGGLLDASTPSAELVTLLQTDAEQYTWVAASVGANSAAGVQLATGEPVMAIGGFNGSDPWPTLEEFETLVAAGEVHYFLSGGAGGGPGGGAGTSSEIAEWVSSTFSSSSVGGATVYDLTTPV